MKEIMVSSGERNEFIDITGEVASALSEMKAGEGVCVVYVPHTTAGITINENADPSVGEDIIEKLSDLVPPSAGYSHTEGNADSHIKATLVGSSVAVPVRGGRLVLGTWQGIFFCEFDGPRRRRVIVQFIPSS